MQAAATTHIRDTLELILKPQVCKMASEASQERYHRCRKLCTLSLLVTALCGSSVGAQQTLMPSTELSSGPEVVTSPSAEAGAFETTASPPPATTIADSGDLSTPINFNNVRQQQHVKIRPVNFTLVDEVFNSALNDSEVIDKWKKMDNSLQDGMKSILKMIFPQIVSLSHDAKVSGDCSGGILKWILSLRNLRSWAIKMLDATGKPTSGILEGSLTLFGNYRQCLSIRVPDEDEIEITDQFEEYFRGQFCVVHMKPFMPVKQSFYSLNASIDSLLRKNYKYYEKTLYDEIAEIAVAFNFIDIRLDLCVPSTCSHADIQRVADLLSKKVEMRAKVMRCDVAGRESSLLAAIDLATGIWLGAPLALIAISVLATLIITCASFKRQQRPQMAQVVSSNKYSLGKHFSLAKSQASFGSRLLQVCETLSIRNALADRLKTANRTPRLGAVDELNEESARQIDDSPLPLYAVRTFFVVWFMIVQMTVEVNYQYLRESLSLRNMIISYWPFQAIVNSSLIFDSLILITGFTLGYKCIEASVGDLARYVASKFVRLAPSIMVLAALVIATPRLEIESPVWRNFVDNQASVCKATGVVNLFFLQNFLHYDKICLPHTWLFCVELQLAVLAIPLVLLLRRSFASLEDSLIASRTPSASEPTLSDAFLTILKSPAGLVAGAAIAAGYLLAFYSVLTSQLPPTWFYTLPDLAQKNLYFSTHLTKFWTHLSVFVVGLLGGHLCKALHLLQRVAHLKARQQPVSKLDLPASCLPSTDSSLSSSRSPSLTGFDSASSAARVASRLTASTITLEPSSELRQTGVTGVVKTRLFAGVFPRVLASRKCVAFIGAFCLITITFTTFNWSTKELPTPLVAAFYEPSARLAWALALVTILLALCLPESKKERCFSRKQSACVTSGSNQRARKEESADDRACQWPSSGASVICHPLLIVFGRLSFLAYLLSPYVQSFVLAVQEQAVFSSLFMIFHVIVGNIVITYTVAFVVSIVIEQPIRRFVRKFVVGHNFTLQKFHVSTHCISHQQSRSQ